MNIFKRSTPKPAPIEIQLSPAEQAAKERDALMIQPAPHVPDPAIMKRIYDLQEKLAAWPHEVADLNDTIAKRAERHRVINENAAYYLEQAKKGAKFDPSKLTTALRQQTEIQDENDDQENARLQQIGAEQVAAREELKRLNEKLADDVHEHACRDYASAMWRLSDLAQRVKGTFQSHGYRVLKPETCIGFPFGDGIRIAGKDYRIESPEGLVSHGPSARVVTASELV
jgi:hypothetical protein